MLVPVYICALVYALCCVCDCVKYCCVIVYDWAIIVNVLVISCSNLAHITSNMPLKVLWYLVGCVAWLCVALCCLAFAWLCCLIAFAWLCCVVGCPCLIVCCLDMKKPLVFDKGGRRSIWFVWLCRLWWLSQCAFVPRLTWFWWRWIYGRVEQGDVGYRCNNEDVTRCRMCVVLWWWHGAPCVVVLLA